MLRAVDDLAYVTPDLPGIGGVLREQPEDFIVEELQKTPPSGAGEHLMLLLQKRELTTLELARRVGKAFRVSPRSVGYAGLKDKQAVTRQHVTVHVPGVETAALAQGVERLSEQDRIDVIWAEPHRAKLRKGHHAGNAFVLTIRQVSPTAVLTAKRVLDHLARVGVPNYIGEQRFGFRRNSHVLGELLLRGADDALIQEMLLRVDARDRPPLPEARALAADKRYEEALALWPRSLRSDRQALDLLRQGATANDVVAALDRTQTQMFTSAWQSAVFNAVLDRRIREQTLHRLLPGDLAWKHDSRAVFAVDETQAITDNASGGRVATLDVSPSGPLWGPAMLLPAEAPLAMEREALGETGLNESDLQKFEGAGGKRGLNLQGQRRPLRVILQDHAVSAGSDERGPFVRLSFTLERVRMRPR